MNDILFRVLEAVVIAATAAVARYLIPYVREKLLQSRYAWLVDVIDAAVRGVEQIMGGGNGDSKKAAVIAYVERWLTDHHVAITQEQLDRLIEAAVHTMNTEIGKNDVLTIQHAAMVGSVGDDGK